MATFEKALGADYVLNPDTDTKDKQAYQKGFQDGMAWAMCIGGAGNPVPQFWVSPEETHKCFRVFEKHLIENTAPAGAMIGPSGERVNGEVYSTIIYATKQELDDAMGIYETGHGDTMFRIKNLVTGEVRIFSAGIVYGAGVDEAWLVSQPLESNAPSKSDEISF